MLLYLPILFLVIIRTVFVHTIPNPYNWQNSLTLDVVNAKPNRSVVIAPLPLRLSLCKLASIAEGATRDQLLTALGYKEVDQVKKYYLSTVSSMIDSLKKGDLILVNKMYVNYTENIDDNFLTNSSILYGVDVDKIGFNLPRAATNFVNNEIASITYRRITDVIDPTDFSNITNIMLISAAHLKTSWEFPFEVQNTKPRIFYNLNNSISQIPMMVRVDSYLQYFDTNFKMISLHLKSPGTIFTLVVPTSSLGMPHLLSLMNKDPDLIGRAREKMTYKPLKLLLPRFRIKSFLDLTENFKKRSTNIIMNSSSSELNNILREDHRKTKTMFVSKVKQKLFIEVDEFGVSRQLQSPGFQSREPKSPMRIPEFAANRPFYFSIDLQEFLPLRNKLLTAYNQLMSGVYYGPE